MIGPYETAQAFRTALEARLRGIAQSQGTNLQRLQRRVAFERLLARLFLQPDPPWMLKGGYALELYLEGRARSTLDLDMSVPDPARLRRLVTPDKDISYAELIYDHVQQVADYDLGDGFQFLIQQPKDERTGAPGGGVRCAVEARLAGRTFARFHLDVGLGDAVLDQPEWVDGSGLLGFAGIPAARVALYPMAQQFAEKVHAYTFPWQDRDNTRVKDLVDLILLVDSGMLKPERVRQAVEVAFKTRDTHPLPPRLPEPPPAWSEPYAALARELVLSASTLEESYIYLSAYWQGWGFDQKSETER